GSAATLESAHPIAIAVTNALNLYDMSSPCNYMKFWNPLAAIEKDLLRRSIRRCSRAIPKK
ncbi:MAG TPA: hypothetical protein VK832_04315, partial [Burkholderiaceae bacterium]|nr:hypothetical protein [Burkholderiaceae bacterium]